MKVFKTKNIGAIILTVLFFAMLYGAFGIYTIAENIEYNADVFLAYPNKDPEVIKFNEKIQNEAKKAARSILDSGINIKVSDFCGKEDIIVCYTRNVYMELDTFSMRPVYMIYECDAKRAKYSVDNCRDIAITFTFRNMPKTLKATEARIGNEYVQSNMANYSIEFGGNVVNVAVRMDTGSVVFYEVSEKIL